MRVKPDSSSGDDDSCGVSVEELLVPMKKQPEFKEEVIKEELSDTQSDSSISLTNTAVFENIMERSKILSAQLNAVPRKTCVDYLLGYSQNGIKKSLSSNDSDEKYTPGTSKFKPAVWQYASNVKRAVHCGEKCCGLCDDRIVFTEELQFVHIACVQSVKQKIAKPGPKSQKMVLSTVKNNNNKGAKSTHSMVTRVHRPISLKTEPQSTDYKEDSPKIPKTLTSQVGKRFFLKKNMLLYCRVCKERFKTYALGRTHYLDVHGRECHDCQYCDAILSTPTALQYHLKVIHRI